MGKLSLSSKNILFYLVWGLLVFVPLYPKFPLINVPKTYVAIRFEDVLIAVVLAIWFFLNLKNLRQLTSKLLTQAILLFWTIGVLTIVSGLFLTHTLIWYLGILHWLRRVEMMGLLFVGMSAIKNIGQVKLILYTVLVETIVIGLYGFGQIWFQFPVISTTNREFSKGLLLHLTPDARVNSTFAGHYDLAIFLSIVIVFMGVYFLFYRKLFHKVVIAGVGVISFLLLGLTAARASFATTIFGLILSFWMMGKRLLIVVVVVAAVLAVGIVPELRHRLVATVTVNLLEGGGAKYQAPAVPIETPLPSDLTDFNQATDSASTPATKSATLPSDIVPGEPINTTELGVYRSFNIRTDVEWPRAIRALEKNPILGTGYSSLTIATDNDFLRSLGETGLFGTIALCLVFFVLFKKYFFALKRAEKFQRYFLVATISASIVVLLTGMTIDALEASKIAVVFWLLQGIAWAVASDVEEN